MKTKAELSMGGVRANHIKSKSKDSPRLTRAWVKLIDLKPSVQ